MKDITVLIPGTTACLRNNGERNIRLIGADMSDDPTMLNMVDAYYAVPRGDDPSYIDVLLDICRKEKVDVVLPIMSVELEKLSVSRDKFESIGTKISVSNIDGQILAEKNKFPELLVMEYLPGAEFTVDALADKGKVLECCCRKGLHMENSIMLDSQVVKRTDIEKLCSNINTYINLDGNIGLDIK